MCRIVAIDIDRWDAVCSPATQDQAIDALERGCVVQFPRLKFVLDVAEQRLLTPAIEGDGKNISFDAARGTLRGHHATDEQSRRLQAMLRRFADTTTTLLDNLLPRYRAAECRARTSFRPAEIAGRPTSWRKDDTRLHIDSFPSSPTRGARILRVFANINPHGQPRIWRLGEPFDNVVRRHLDALRGPLPGFAPLLELMTLTKGRRSAYDHLMLALHDRMKADARYQAEAPQFQHEFAAGSAWIVFTDQVSHAAMRGQHALEQTFVVPLEHMREPARAPLARLERLLGRELVQA
jgi:hypothetical protein